MYNKDKFKEIFGDPEQNIGDENCRPEVKQKQEYSCECKGEYICPKCYDGQINS